MICFAQICDAAGNVVVANVEGAGAATAGALAGVSAGSSGAGGDLLGDLVKREEQQANPGEFNALEHLFLWRENLR